jgi:hypothetical protein
MSGTAGPLALRAQRRHSFANNRIYPKCLSNNIGIGKTIGLAGARAPFPSETPVNRGSKLFRGKEEARLRSAFIRENLRVVRPEVWSAFRREPDIQKRASSNARSLFLVRFRCSNDLGLTKVVDLVDEVIRDELIRRDLLLRYSPFLHEVDIRRVVLLRALPPFRHA